MTKTELQAIIDNPASDEQQRQQAQTLLDKMDAQYTSTCEVNLPEWWADLARTDRDPVRRAHKFKQLRETYKNNPEALACFTAERENMRAKRAVYDIDGGDIIGYAYDEDIPALLAAKGRGYYGTEAYYVEMRHMTSEAATEAAKLFGDREARA